MTPRSGFTLIELMIVVVIIGILAAVAIPKFADVSRESKQAEAGPLLKQILTLQERYKARSGAYTLDITELEGGATLANSGKFFTYSIVAHATGFCAVATPSGPGTTAGLSARSMDAQRNLFQSSSCS